MNIAALTPSKMEKTTTPPNVYQLPEKLTPAITSLGEAALLFYGELKIGKTSLASMFPNNFFIFTERSGKGLNVFGESVISWVQFKNVLRSLKLDERFETVTVDTIDRLHEFCTAFVCEKEGFKHPGDLSHGKGWHLVDVEWTKFTAQLLKLDKGIIFISHAKEEKFESRGTTYSKIVPSYGTPVKRLVGAEVDVILYYGYVGTQRYLIIEGDQNLEAGNRLEQHFLLDSEDEEKVTHIPAGKNKKEAYDNFIAAFNNQQKSNPDLKGKIGLSDATKVFK